MNIEELIEKYYEIDKDGYLTAKINCNEILEDLEQLKEEQEQLINKYPNDADLGKAVRLNQNKKFKQL